MNFWKSLSVTTLLLLTMVEANSATPSGHQITNNAVINYSIETNAGNSPSVTNVTLNSSVTSVTASNLPAQIGLGTVSIGGTNGTLQASSCIGNTGTTVLPNPTYANNTTLPLPQNITFTDKRIVKAGDPLFIRVYDLDHNVDPTVAEPLDVTITNTLGDIETIRLYETGPSTGLFVGYIQTLKNTPVQGDCQLSVKSNDTITVSYNSNNGTNTIEAMALVDPLGTVFDSVTGIGINGATVSLINVQTNLPAQVFGDDGVSSYPSTVISGANVTDSSGVNYIYGTGQFRFPLVAPGTYRVAITPPTNYSFPSQVDDATLNQRFGNQYIIIPGGSKGSPFNVVDQVVQVDIPLDVRSGELLITKTASASVAAIGDFLQYQINIQNNDAGSVNNVVFEDILPKGFRYRAGSFYINGQKATPQITKGTLLQYNFGTLAPSQNIDIKYVTEITVASSLGNVTNKASVRGTGATSNIASATVFIKDDLMMDKAIIVGTVYETADCNRATLKRVPNVRIQFETGDYVISDSEGLWHIDTLTPRTHVAKLDKLYLPKGYEPALCEDNNTFAGNPNSKFVEATPGSIVRADFYLKKIGTDTSKKEPVKELNIADLLATAVAYTPNENDPLSPNFKERSGTEALSYNEKFMLTATPEPKFLFPNSEFNPHVMAIGIAFQAPSDQNVKMYMNGSLINQFNFDGQRQSADKTTNIIYWRGVAIKEGVNLLVAQLFDASNKQVGEVKKEVTFSNVLSQAIFVPSQSKLVSDGKTPIEIAVRFIDEFNHPAHKGLTGTYEVDGATPFVTRGDGLPLDMLGALRENKTQYTVGEDGIAMIKLMASNNAGEVTLRFTLKDKVAIVRPWISSAKREWILVGIGEGTLAHNSVLNHTSADTKGMEVIEDKDGRIALYGKGTITGDYLLTLAYDNKKKTLEQRPIGQTSSKLTVDELYSVYGDATIAQKDAESDKNLYIRIEKNQFYAMFGNFETNLTVTDLTRYQRSLTGFKSEYKGDKISYNAFAAKSSTLLQKEEIPSDGTTGLYRTRASIEENSETVTVVTRNRNQRDVVVDSRSLTRYIDYDIDYDLGTIRLKDAPPVYDIYFNPIFIRVEYNSIDKSGDHTVAGGRVAYKIQEHTEIGVTHINDSGVGSKESMSGIDLQYDDQHLKVKLETAIGDNKELDSKTSTSAYNAEVQYQDEWGSIKGYTKKIDDNFGMSSALPNDVGIEKTGADLTVRLSNDMTLRSEALSQKDLTNDSKDQLIDTKVEKKFSENFTGYAGVKVEKTENPTGQISNSVAEYNDISSVPSPVVSGPTNETNTLYTIGGQYKFSTIPLKLTGQIEANTTPSDVAPSRFKVGAEYDISEKITLVADNEYNQYASTNMNLTRFGIKTKPWEGGRVQGYTGKSMAEDSNQFYQLGFDQNFKYQNWTFDAGIARQEWSKQIDLSQVPVGTLLNYDNYNVYQLGAVYRKDPFIYQSKIEKRVGSDQNKLHIENDIYKKLGGGFAVSLGQDYQTVTQAENEATTAEIKGGLSYRDPKDVNTLLMQLSYIGDKQNNAGTQNSDKIILNSHYNYKPNYNWEAMGHVGYKYVKNTFDEDEYKGSSYVLSTGVRNYFAPKWDWALQGLYAASPSSGVTSKGASLSLGYRVIKDGWVSVGYQKMDNYDKNFSFDESYIKGVFVKFRFKFDEETFHLNSKNNIFSNIMSK